MPAYLNTQYKQGFYVSEESLIKLVDIVRRRLSPSDPASKIKFRVFRTDGMVIEYESPTQVVSEENAPRNAAKRVEVIGEYSETSSKFKIVFDREDSIDLQLQSENRDLAFLLFSDIKEYLQAEVLRFRSFSVSAMLGHRLFLAPLVLVPFLAFFATLEAPNQETLQAVLDSDDLHRKLDFIINRSNRIDSLGSLKLMGAVSVGMIVVIAGGFPLLQKVFPRNIFYWGKAATSYDRITSMRDKFLWGVLVAFVIGVATTLFVDFMKNPK